MSVRAKTVAIVGAGMGGIRTAKAAEDAGFVSTVFERSAHIGGVWSPTGIAWESMHTNIGTYSMSFTEFPWPSGELRFANSRKVHQYLLNYIEHFGIKDCFRLSTEIQSIRQTNDKRWEITAVKDGIESTEIFNFCILATGMNSNPKMPTFDEKGMSEFKGLFMHSADYKSNDEKLKSKRVIVVGGSASATEIASDLVGQADRVDVLIRKSYLIFPKMVKLKNQEGSVKISSLECLVMNRNTFYGPGEGSPRNLTPFSQTEIYVAK